MIGSGVLSMGVLVMHELSIAMRLVEMVEAEVTAAGGGRVEQVRLRIGQLAGVHEAALRFAFEQARVGTVASEATLSITDLPVAVFCPACQQVLELPTITPLACPACGQSTGDIRLGHELDLESIELTEETS
jgi:hydrogenase nickel incorporation protein HypA/HybF